MTAPAMARLSTIFALFSAIGAQGYDPEASITGLYTGPYFDPLAARNFTAHLGDQAILPCTVRQLGDKSVSWVRMRDADILTVDRYTFVGDERFESHYSAPLETWNLVVKYVQERDAGLYECQVSTEPKMSQLFSLRVVIPKVSILPPGDRYVKAGSQVRIDCQITDVVQLPDYIFWYHEDKRVMDHLDSNLVVTVKNTGVEAITSTLIVHKVPPEGSGNYTCMPSNLHSASVILHVLNEKHPAAMQGERNGGSWQTESQAQILVFLILFVMFHRATYLNLNEGDNEATSENRNPLAGSASPPEENTSSSSSLSSSLSQLQSPSSYHLDEPSMKKILKTLKMGAHGAGDAHKKDVEYLCDSLQGDSLRDSHGSFGRPNIISRSRVDLFLEPPSRVLKVSLEIRNLVSAGEVREGSRVTPHHPVLISKRIPMEINIDPTDRKRFEKKGGIQKEDEEERERRDKGEEEQEVEGKGERREETEVLQASSRTYSFNLRQWTSLLVNR